jgi:PAS domain S-box-containing protein
MLSELLHDRAALYVSGAMTATERENFELVLEFHADLGAHVAELEQVTARVILADTSNSVAPPAGLKQRLLASIEALPRPSAAEAIVVTDKTGAVEWVNTSFSAMCGYTLHELKGRKPGALLQGPATDAKAVQRIRDALRGRRSCREALVNYHKDGTVYRTEIAITPVLDDVGEPLWFVAKEHLLPLSAAGVSD